MEYSTARRQQKRLGLIKLVLLSIFTSKSTIESNLLSLGVEGPMSDIVLFARVSRPTQSFPKTLLSPSSSIIHKKVLFVIEIVGGSVRCILDIAMNYRRRVIMPKRI